MNYYAKALNGINVIVEGIPPKIGQVVRVQKKNGEFKIEVIKEILWTCPIKQLTRCKIKGSFNRTDRDNHFRLIRK